MKHPCSVIILIWTIILVCSADFVYQYAFTGVNLANYQLAFERSWYSFWTIIIVWFLWKQEKGESHEIKH